VDKPATPQTTCRTTCGHGRVQPALRPGPGRRWRRTPEVAGPGATTP